jgi:hypothetical protein
MKVITDDKHYKDIASAIREQRETEEQYKPGEMADAVRGIAKVNNEEITITANGEYTPSEGYTGFGKVVADVAVDTSIEDGLITGTLTSYTNDRVESVRDYAFYNQPFEIVNLPRVKTLGKSAFYQCAVSTLDFPLVEVIPDSLAGSSGTNNITSVNFPNAVEIGQSAFNFCRKLTFVDFPKVKSIKSQAFYNATNLVTIVLRSPELCTLASSSIFSSYIVKTFLFPAALIESYQTATNWSAMYASGKAIFLPLEEYTVDGTTTGEIDWDKLNGEVTA